MKLGRLAIVALAAASFACSTLQVNTDYDPGTDFSKYKSFSLKHGAAAKDSIAVERFETALATALAARGLTRVPEGGDLTMFAHFVIGKETQLNTTGYGYGGWYGARWGGMGGMQTTTVQEIPTGTVVVDLVDSKSSKAVWRGMAKDQISTSASPEDRAAKANQVSQELFAKFPPSAAKK